MLDRTIKKMMKTKIDEHLGYSKSKRSDNDDYLNGYKSKRIHNSYGSMDIEVSQDRKSTFKPQIVKKHKRTFQILTRKSY